jgi:tetratricopeptide (TPR) repeat protein
VPRQLNGKLWMQSAKCWPSRVSTLIALMLLFLMPPSADAEVEPDVARGIARWTEAVQLNPGNPNAFVERGLLYFKIGDIDRAASDFSEAIRLDPMNAETYSLRAACWVAKGSIEQAVNDYTDAIRLNPTNSTAYKNRGLVRWEFTRDLQAIKDLDRAIELDPKSATAYADRGTIFFFTHELDAAIADLTKSLELDPYRSSVHELRGLAWLAQSSFGNATKDLDAAIILNPKAADAYNTLAWVSASCPDDRYRDGRKAVKNAIEACRLRGWKDAEFLDTLAAAYAESGDFDRAIESEQKAIELANDDEGRRVATKRLDLYKSKMPYRDIPQETAAKQ